MIYYEKIFGGRMSVFWKKLAIACVIPSYFLIACNDQKETQQTTEVFPRAETLYIGGFDWAAPKNFNPLNADPNFPIDGNVRLLYEALFAYDPLEAKLEPMLAKSFTETDSSIMVELDSRARWNDGKPVTTKDVTYTFYLDSILPTPRHGSWEYLKNITSENNTIEFHFNPTNPSPLMILNILAGTSILPKHVFAPLIEQHKQASNYDYSQIAAFDNSKNPVASGPYRLHSFSPEKIVLERDSAYWGNVKYNGKQPVPRFIIHSLYAGNNAFNSAMTKGNLDLSSDFLPHIQNKLRDSIRAWSLNPPYHNPGAIVTLIINHQKPPFNDSAFRHAISHIVDFEKIRERAISGYSPTIRPGLILPFGKENQYFDEEDATRFGNQFDTAKAKEILANAGYSWNASGILEKDGKQLPTIHIECPKGWTDWEDAILVIVGSMKEIGIPAEKSFVDYPVWETNLRLGTFDLAMKTQTADLSVATPWFRLQQLLYSNSLPEPGKPLYFNQGRYENKKVNELLDIIPTLKDSTALRKTYKELNRIVMQDIPVIPVFYKPTQYYQFSTKNWTNFPTEENPYAPPENLITAAGVKALWSIRQTKKQN